MVTKNTHPTNRGTRLRFQTITAVVALLAALPVAAIVYVMPSDESMVDRSPIIVFGEVLSAQPGTSPDSPTTDYLFAVEEVLKGFVASSGIMVRQPGGLANDGTYVWIMGLPMMAEGDRVLLFLRPEEQGAHAIVDYALGMFWEVDAGGRSMLLREPSLRLAAAADDSAVGERPQAQLSRDAVRFRRWIADRATGADRVADYFATDLPARSAAVDAAFTPSGSNGCPRRDLPIRWRQFDRNESVGLLVQAKGQPGVPGGGVSQVLAAMRAWNKDPRSRIHLVHSDSTNEVFSVRADGISSVTFEDPHDDIEGTFDPGTGGVLTLGYWYYRCIPHGIPGPDGAQTLAYELVEVDITTQDGYRHWAASQPNPTREHERIMAHELGHALGLGHGCADHGSGPCDMPQQGKTIMQVATDKPPLQGVLLKLDDRNRARVLYPTPNVAATTAPCSGDTCLLQGQRFRVKARYSKAGAPSQSAGATEAALANSAGLFSAGSGSPELLVRIGNRCRATGYWEVYAGVASDADFSVAVRHVETNELKWFRTRDRQSIADTEAFACTRSDDRASPASPGGAADGAACSGVTCLLQEDRFRLKSWYAHAGGSSQAADAIPVYLGESAGLFAFDSGNPELLIRIADTCSTSGYWTVYAGTASDAGFRVAIRDTETNELKWFRSRGGQSVADAETFPCGGAEDEVVGTDFDLDSDNTRPRGITYAQGRFYVFDTLGKEDRVYTYRGSDGRRDPAADFEPDPDNTDAVGITYAKGRFYVVDWAGEKVYAYRGSDGRRDPAADFELDPDNIYPFGITYAQGRFYVGDYWTRKVHAYRGSDGRRDLAADFELDPRNRSFSWGGITYAQGSFFVVDPADAKVYAYRDSDGSRDATAEFELDSNNTHPIGIASAHGRFYVVDWMDEKVYAYSIDRDDDGTPVPDVVVGTDFELDSENGTPVGITYAQGRFYVVDWFLKDDKVYAYRGSDGRRDAAADFDLDSDNTHPQGITYAQGRFYVVDWIDEKVYAYRGSDGRRDPAADFELDSDNRYPNGITYGQGRFYVADYWAAEKVYAYRGSDGRRDAAADFDLDSSNATPSGIAYAQSRFYVVDQPDNRVYAYRGSDGRHDEATDFELDSDNTSSAGITYAQGRFYVVDSTDDKVYVYSPDGSDDGTSAPDLVVESPRSTTSSVAPGGAFRFTATVRNQGDGPSAATTLRYHRSSDPTISTSDTQVGTDAVSALSASGTSAESISLTAPSSAGTYYYGACVDSVSGESSTGNNCSSAVRLTVSGGSDGGACRAGLVVNPGESCTYKGHTFRVDSSGTARIAFFQSTNRIYNTGTVNGVRWNFDARRNAGSSSWTIHVAD